MVTTKCKNFGILILIFSIFLISNVAAQPPQTVTQTNVNLEVGLQIQTPGIIVLQQNTNHTFSFHVFNISTGLLVDNSTTACSFHLYNKTGQHHFNNDDLEFSDNDFEVEISGANFTELGIYSYYVNCNATAVGGFAREVFEITQTGQSLDEPQSLIILGLILVLILVTWVFLYFGKAIEYVPFKIFLISLGGLFLMFTVGFSLNIIRNLVVVGSVFSITFVNLYRLMLILISAGGIGLMVYIVYMSVKQFYRKRGLIDSEGEPRS